VKNGEGKVGREETNTQRKEGCIPRSAKGRRAGKGRSSRYGESTKQGNRKTKAITDEGKERHKEREGPKRNEEKKGGDLY